MALSSIILPIQAATPDPTNPPAMLFTTANRPYLAFSTGVDEKCLWTFRLPENYASAPDIIVQYSMDTDTTNNIVMAVEIMAVADGSNIETDSFDTANASSSTAVPGTATFMDEITIDCSTNDGAPSAMAAGTYAVIRLSRDQDNAGDDASGDVFVWDVTLEYTTT